MLSRLMSTYAVLALLAGAAPVEELCDGQDMLWSDLADNSTIKAVFSQACSKLSTNNNGTFIVRTMTAKLPNQQPRSMSK